MHVVKFNCNDSKSTRFKHIVKRKEQHDQKPSMHLRRETRWLATFWNTTLWLVTLLIQNYNQKCIFYSDLFFLGCSIKYICGNLEDSMVVTSVSAMAAVWVQKVCTSGEVEQITNSKLPLDSHSEVKLGLRIDFRMWSWPSFNNCGIRVDSAYFFWENFEILS